MSNHVEWAVPTDISFELAPMGTVMDDGQEIDRQYGLVLTYDGDRQLVIESDTLDQLHSMAVNIALMVERAQHPNGPDLIGPPNPAHASAELLTQLDDDLAHAGEIVRRMRGDRT